MMTIILISNCRLLMTLILAATHECRLLPPRTTRGEFVAHHRQGDLQLGFLANIHKTGEDDGEDKCSKTPADHSLVTAAAIEFAISEVNRREDILPNITIGYVVKDACGNDINALARSLFLVDSHLSTCVDNQTSTVDKHLDESSPVHRNVVGVIGHVTSRQAVMVAPFLSVFEVPFIGTMATSDELSDKSRFEYFLRLLPPDTVTVTALIDVLVHYNWTYVTVVYTDGSYGEFGFKSITKLAKGNGICLATSHRIPADATTEDYEAAIESIKSQPKARTVVVFGEFGSLLQFFGFVNRKVGRLNNILLGGSSTCAYGNIPFVAEAVDGLICVGYQFRYPPGFVQFYNNMRPESENIPWLKELWGHEFTCGWKGNETTSCENITLHETEDTLNDFVPDKIFEGVYTFAHAMDKVIQHSCPSSSKSKADLEECLKGPELLDAIRKSSFEGLTSDIKFNHDGEIVAHYLVKQIVRKENGRFRLNIIGHWAEHSDDNNTLVLFGELAPWSTHLTTGQDGGELLPESVCSHPCGIKQYRIRLEQICCWNCHDCGINEVLVDNATGCEECPLYSWPDEDSATVCEVVQPTYLALGDAVANGLVVASGLGVISSLAIGTIFILHSKTRLVKSSNKQISALMLFGATLACLVMFSFMSMPNNFICGVRYVGFHFSVNLLYGPLFVKTIRIYRIFASGKRGNTRPHFVSNSWQTVFTLIATIIQVKNINHHLFGIILVVLLP